MCRIVGIASLKSVAGCAQVLQSMVRSLAHGGPDDEGVYLDGKVALGHRRLSIIDLSAAGHQPMTLGDELVISFNGEIYNYRTLKKELEVLGVIFRTQSDTEVILRAYRQWGAQAFDRLEGIFAFALYDRSRQKLLLVRDHIGVKPLYYFIDHQQLVFASEVRAFQSFRKDWEENENWKILFLAFGSIPHPYTTLRGVYQLQPGTFLEVNLNDFTHSFHEYKQAPKTAAHSNANEELETIRASVKAAVQKNLISDAPLGVFLSGGIDSSLLTLLADQIQDNVKTVSINFDEASFDEYPFQKMVLEKTRNVDHTSHRITEKIFWEDLADIWNAMDQPTIDGVNTYFISKCARRDGLKTVLSGLGADEIFGGYASFKRIRLLRRIRTVPFKRAVAKIIGYRRHAYRRVMYLEIPGPIGDYLFLRGIHTPDIISSLLGITEQRVWNILRALKLEMPPHVDDRAYVSLLESKIYMTNQLLRDTDCMSMWHGLEVRVPFLDISLLREVDLISPENRYKDIGHKYLLTASNPDLIPKGILAREKKGFTFPMANWMRRSPERFKQLIEPGKTADRIVNGFNMSHDHWSKYWSLAVLNQYRASKG
jgi:asparagine synthase (glutamine-hydrolysing)